MRASDVMQSEPLDFKSFNFQLTNWPIDRQFFLDRMIHLGLSTALTMIEDVNFVKIISHPLNENHIQITAEFILISWPRGSQFN